MVYQVTLLDRARREAQIAQSISASKDFEDFHDFRGAKTSLPVIRIPIGLPVYRMENFRTFSEQAEYMARERKTSDFFKAGQENESVQQIQHEVLARLAAKGKASSVVPVIDVLEREGQRETLLITHRGVVVNGNRRLAAMRELFARDASAYHQFSHVNCKILPADTTPIDILEIEAILQARPETRLDYDWIGDAQLVTAMLKVKGKVEEVAKLLNRKPAEVKIALQALSEANIYLKDWIKAEGEYNRVAEYGEQFFKDLPVQIQGRTPELQEASRAIAWSLFDNRDKLNGRLYNYNAVFGKRVDDVLNRLAEDLGIPLSNSEEEHGDDFDFDLGEDTTSLSYQPLIDVFKDESRKGEAIDALVEISESIIESEKDKKSSSAALKAITSAHAKLAEVDLSRAGKATYDAIDRQLLAVVQRAGQLQAQMRKMREQPATPPPEDGGFA